MREREDDERMIREKEREGEREGEKEGEKER